MFKQKHARVLLQVVSTATLTPSLSQFGFMQKGETEIRVEVSGFRYCGVRVVLCPACLAVYSS